MATLLRILQRQPASRPEPQSCIIELIYAGNAMAELLTAGTACICGEPLTPRMSVPTHHNFCPVARFQEAVEAVRKSAL